MSKEIGKIDKPAAENTILKRKIYLVQNIQNYFPENNEFKTLLEEYWDSISDQLDKMESTAGIITNIYIEGMWQSFQEVEKIIQESSPASLKLIKTRIGSGSNYIPVEDESIYKRLIDLTRIVQLGFVSEKIKTLIEEQYSETVLERQIHIKTTIDQLQLGEAGLFMLSSVNHKFSDDIEIFNVIPPALDKINRWLQNNQQTVAAQQEKDREESEEGQNKDSGLWTP